MKNLALKLATVSLSVFACASAARAGFNQYSIGLNFGSSDGNNNNNGRVRALADPDVAGLPAVEQPFWNNMPGATGFSNAVVNNSGGSVSVGVSWNSPLGTWSSGANTANFFATNTPNNVLAMGYLDNGTTTTVMITNLPSNFTANGYDVYVYTFFDTPNRGGTYTIVDAFNTGTTLSGPQFENSDGNPTNFVQYPQSGNTNLSGNYLVFHGLTNANIQLNAVANHGGTLRAPISAIQVVAAPATGEAGQVTGLAVSTNVVGQITLSWTPGSGSSGSIVVMRAGFPATAEPVDGVTYTANSSFGSGDNLGDDNLNTGNFVVLAGAGSSVSVSNVFASSNYYFAVYSFTGSGVSTDYTLATPPVTNAIPNGTITNLTLIPPSVPVVAGSARTVRALASFNDGGVLDVSASTTFTSSAPAVLSIVSPGRVAALTNGVATLAAIYKGFTNSQSVTVTSLSLTHRYSFNEGFGTTNATDSVAGADGIVISDGSSGMDGSGLVVLSGAGATSGSSNSYVQLPSDLLTNYGGLTLEMWATDTGSGSLNWARFFEYGMSLNGVGTRYLFLTPWVGNGAQLRAAITMGAGEQQVNFLAPPAAGTEHQFVLTINGATRTGALYVDGVRRAANTNLTLTPEDVGSGANTWLGRSLFNVDNLLIGTFNELRVYNGSLDPFQIAVDSSAGPNLPNSSPGNLTNLVLSVPLNPVPQFQIQQASVLGYFDGLSGPIELSTAGKLVYTTSDPNVATIDANGQVTATGAGNATLRAIWPTLKTNSLVLTVTPVPPGITHRWSFNGDYSDSVGGSAYVATPHGNANIGLIANQVVLDGTGAAGATTGTYVELPPNLLLGYSSIVFEMWETDQDQVNGWGRIFDFSSSTANYIFLTPLVGNNRPAFPYIMRTAFLLAGQTGGEETINIARPTTNAEHQIVYIIDATTLTGRLYVDGVLQLERNGTRQPKDLGPTPNDWIGRSPFGDPLWIGSMNEFRLYNGTISDQQVLLDYLAGPDVVNSTGGGISGVSMALSNAPVGNLQQAHVLANYITFGLQPVMGGSSNWVSSDLTVAKVDSKGNVYSVGAGTATISGTYNGLTAASNITVSASAPTLLHRYSFDGDATDSVGGANGTLQPGALVSGGVVNLTGATNSYVILPGHLLDGLDEVTIETWLTYSNGQAGNNRAWDFGDSLTTNYLYFSPISPGNTVLRWAFETNPSPNTVGVPAGTLVENTYTKSFRGDSAGIRTIHYIWTLSDRLGKSDFYMNGDQDTFPYNWLQTSPTLSRLVNTETYLGHGSRTNPASPANLQGSINEFRIWRGAFNNIQARASFAAGPSNVVINPGSPTTLTITPNDPTMVLGAIQRPKVTGTFASVGVLDLTSGADVVLTSSDPTKVKIVGDGLGGDKAQAVGVGSANIIASYGGKTATNAITVIAAPTLRLAHRYNFNGTTADLVGHADARLFGNAVLSSTAVVLDGSTVPTSYVLLPGDLISGFDKATFEAWGRTGGNTGGSQQRLFDFGNRFSAAGFNYFYYTPGNAGRVGLPGQQGEFQLNSGAFPNNANFNVTITVDSANGRLIVYTNGVVSLGSTNRAVTLSLINDVNTMLGRSQFGDPTLNGSIDEFRIYNGIMSPAQVAASFAAGASAERLTARTDGGSNVIITWPNSLVTEGYALQYATTLTPPVSWQAAGAPTVVGNNNQVTIPITNSESYFRLTK